MAYDLKVILDKALQRATKERQSMAMDHSALEQPLASLAHLLDRCLTRKAEQRPSSLSVLAELKEIDQRLTFV